MTVMCTPTDEACSICRAPECALVDQFYRLDGRVLRRFVCERCHDATSAEARAFDHAHRWRVRAAGRAQAA